MLLMLPEHIHAMFY